MDSPIISLINYEALPQKVITQKWLSNKTEFTLNSDHLLYTLASPSNTRSVKVNYDDIDFQNITTLTERNIWLRNAGLLWLGIGIVGTAMKASLSIWLAIGLVCLFLHYMFKTSYSVIAARAYNILVIKNKKHDEIISLIKEYYKNHLRQYVNIIPSLPLPNNMSRLTWYRDNEVITQSEFEMLEKALYAYDNVSSQRNEMLPESDHDSFDKDIN